MLCALLASAPLAAEEELLVDPENPGSVEVASDADEEVLVDPQNTGTHDSTATAASASLVTATLLGTWRTTGQVDLAWDGTEDVFEHLTTFGLRLELQQGSLSAAVEGEFEHWWATPRDLDGRRASYEPRLGEAYVFWREDGLTLGAGNMVHRWGVTDLSRPGDVVNPVDLTMLTPDRAQQRIPQFTLESSWAASTWQVTGIVVPFFVPNRAWAFGRDTAAFSPQNPAVADAFPISPLVERLFDTSLHDDVQPALGATEVPDEFPTSASAGVRLTATWANTDLGLSYFYGWDRTASVRLDPDLREILSLVATDTQFVEDLDFTGLLQRNPSLLGLLNGLSGATQPPLEVRHERLQTLLVEAARYVGPIGVRTDVAFWPQKTFITRDFTSVRTPAVGAALGLSWENLVDESNAQLVSIEGFWTEPFEPGEYLVVGRRSAGTSVAVQWSSSFAEARAVGIVDAMNPSLIASLSLAHRFDAALRVGVGLGVFEPWGSDPSITAARILDGQDFASITADGNF